MTALTASERLEHLDESAESLKSALLAAAEELDRSDQVPSEVTGRLAGQIQRLPRAGITPADFDREQLHGAYEALLDMRDLLDRREGAIDLDTLDELLVAVERFRHVIRDAIDEEVPGLSDATAPVVAQLRAWLPGIAKPRLAGLLGIDVRTLSRWEKRAAPPGHRLALVAKLVGVLRHSWTPEGVLAWFERPRAELAGRRPIELLDMPDEAPALLAAARGTRSMYAT